MLPTNKHRLIALTVACCLLAAWSAGNRLERSFPKAGTWDFPIFAAYADGFLSTGMLYDRDLGKYEPNAAVYKFPPLSGSVLVAGLKAGFSAPELETAGAILQLASFFGGILWLTLVLIPENRTAACALALCLTAALLPTLEENLLRLQLEPALLFLSIVAAICVYKDKNFIAGLMVGIAAMLKLYPVMALVFFVVSRRWSACYGFVAAAILTSIFSIATIGYAEHYFYITKILPILLSENPITDPENISMGRLLLSTNMDMPYLKIISRIILLASFLLSFHLLKASRNVAGIALQKQINVLIFSLFIPFTLAGMNNTLWNYQLLLALPLTVLSCLWLSSAIYSRGKMDLWSLGIFLLTLAGLHIAASATVDDQFYQLPLTQLLTIILFRILAPVPVVFIAWRVVHRNND
jgi:hypothetical protein